MADPAHSVLVCGVFDDIRSRHLRFLHEASRRGPVTVLLLDDELVAKEGGAQPGFPVAERLYFLRSVRFVSQVVTVKDPGQVESLLKRSGVEPEVWVSMPGDDCGVCDGIRKKLSLQIEKLSSAELQGFPEIPPMPQGRHGGKKVIVTGCYDWFHSGHVRFFEEVSTYGDLYVVVGHDANIRLLKGDGHPLVPEQERRYVAGCIRFVTQSLISSGHGWLDAEPEMLRIRPDIYAVNEDGDKGGKREYCEAHGMQYLVLKRTPAPGLQPRSSTKLKQELKH